MSKTPHKDYTARMERFNRAVSLKRPDRVPLVCLAQYYPLRAAGLTHKEGLYDYELRNKAFKEFALNCDFDLAPTPGVLLPGKACDLIGLQQFQWAGGDFPDDMFHRFVEKEYLLSGEYDEFLSDPEGVTLRKVWPRLAGAYAPLASLPPLHSFLDTRGAVLSVGMLAGMPPFKRLLEKLLLLADEVKFFHQSVTNYMVEMYELGYPVIFSSGARVPFDMFSYCLRGDAGCCADMRQYPEQLLQAMDLVAEHCHLEGVRGAKRANNSRVFITLHRGAAGFMSDRQFKKFYWPGLKALLLALIEAGLTPMVYFKGDYSPRLKYLAELPPGKIVGHFDEVDRRKAKKMIGDTICFWGNVPARKMIQGSPAQIRDDVKALIDIFGDNGGLIIDASTGIPDETRPENMAAMVETVFEYGHN